MGFKTSIHGMVTRMIDFILRWKESGSALVEFVPPDEPVFAEQLLAAAAKLETYAKHMLVRQIEDVVEKSNRQPEKLVIAKPGFVK